MYLDFYNLEKHPFQIAPDYHFLYLSRQHARAMAYMKYTVVNHEGFAVISGEIGSGKTTLVQKFLAEMDRNVTVVRVTQSLLNAIEFLQTVTRGLGAKTTANEKVALHNEIRRELEQLRRRSNNVLLLVDDAQNLEDAVLEEIRLLADTEAEHGSALSVILVGQPELEQRLKQPTLRQLDQRVRLRFKLGPLSEEETDLYIQFRMKLAGWEGPPLFEADVCYAVHRYTRGVPRLINILCDSILLNAFVENENQLSVKLVEAAAAELEWDTSPPLGASQPYTHTAAQANMAHLAQGSATTPVLQVSTHEGFVETFMLSKPVVSLGRISENDLQLSHPQVGAFHAVIVNTGHAYFLVDLDSNAGTTVDGRPITRHKLVDGMVFRISPYVLEFVIPRETEQSETKEDNDRENTRETSSTTQSANLVAAK